MPVHVLSMDGLAIDAWRQLQHAPACHEHACAHTCVAVAWQWHEHAWAHAAVFMDGEAAHTAYAAAFVHGKMAHTAHAVAFMEDTACATQVRDAK